MNSIIYLLSRTRVFVVRTSYTHIDINYYKELHYKHLFKYAVYLDLHEFRQMYSGSY